MKTIVVAGGSGVVGTRVPEHLLPRHDVSQVVAVGRRALSTQSRKVASAIVNLQDRASIASVIPADVEIAFCCLGTTMKKAGSKEAFRAVDYDAIVAFAQAALARGAQRFLLVSSVGASTRTRNFYLRTKGEAEEAIAGLGFKQLSILRPSFIDDEGTRQEYRAAERLMLPVARAFFSLVGRTSRYAPIRADVIARAMVRLAFDETTERIRTVESDQIHVLAR